MKNERTRPRLPRYSALEVYLKMIEPYETEILGKTCTTIPYGEDLDYFLRYWEDDPDTKKTALEVIDEHKLAEVEAESFPRGTVKVLQWTWNDKPVDMFLSHTVISLVCPPVTFDGKHFERGRDLQFGLWGSRALFRPEHKWARLMEFRAALLEQFTDKSLLGDEDEEEARE